MIDSDRIMPQGAFRYDRHAFHYQSHIDNNLCKHAAYAEVKNMKFSVRRSE